MGSATIPAVEGPKNACVLQLLLRPTRLHTIVAKLSCFTSELWEVKSRLGDGKTLLNSLSLPTSAFLWLGVRLHTRSSRSVVSEDVRGEYNMVKFKLCLSDMTVVRRMVDLRPIEGRKV